MQEIDTLNLTDLGPLRRGRKHTRTIPNGQFSRVAAGNAQVIIDQEHGISQWLSKRGHDRQTWNQYTAPERLTQPGRPIATASIMDMVLAQSGLDI